MPRSPVYQRLRGQGGVASLMAAAYAVSRVIGLRSQHCLAPMLVVGGGSSDDGRFREPCGVVQGEIQAKMGSGAKGWRLEAVLHHQLRLEGSLFDEARSPGFSRFRAETE